MDPDTFDAVHYALTGGHPLDLLDDDTPADDAPDETVVNRATVAAMLDKLGPRRAYVIRTYYGIDTAPLSDAEIARTLRVSKARVTTLRTEALRLLRGDLREPATAAA